MKDQNQIVCIIPARGGSKGLPQKNIRPLGDRPLIEWSICQALSSKYLGSGKVFVTSDDPKVLSISETAGAHCILRPAELSTDQSPTEPALIHAVQYIEIKLSRKVDIIVFLQCTSPFRRKFDIDKAVEKLLEEDADSLFSATPIKDYFVWGEGGDSAESKNFDYKNRRRRQELESLFLENGSIYVFRRDLLLNSKNRLGGRIAIYGMPKLFSFQIDEPEDFEICEALVNAGVAK